MTVPRDIGATDDIDTPWPSFLDLLDADPRRALEGLHEFAWKLFVVRPPSILRTLDPSDQQDRIADLVVSCCTDEFEKIRRYRNVGRPFAAWLSTVLVRQVLDWKRRQRMTEELDENTAGLSQDPPANESHHLLECLGRCMEQLSDKCRFYLACAADGMRPREVALLLRLPEGENKRISDDLRHCLRRMRELLLREGVRPEDVA